MYQANLNRILMANGVMVNGSTGRDVAQPSIQRVGTQPTWSAFETLKHERFDRDADARLRGLKRKTAPCRLPTVSRPSLVRLPAFSRGG